MAAAKHLRRAAERLSVAVTATRSETASPPDTHADLATSEPSIVSSTHDTPSVAAMLIAASAPLGPPREVADGLRFARLSRLAWATLFQRVFDIDPLECPRCGGRMRFVQVLGDVTSARSELRVGISRMNRRPCRGPALPIGPTDGAIPTL